MIILLVIIFLPLTIWTYSKISNSGFVGILMSLIPLFGVYISLDSMLVPYWEKKSYITHYLAVVSLCIFSIILARKIKSKPLKILLVTVTLSPMLFYVQTFLTNTRWEVGSFVFKTTSVIVLLSFIIIFIMPPNAKKICD